MDLTSDEKYITAWWLSSNNVGDNLNHFIISELSGKNVVMALDRNKPHYVCCGSILGEYTEASSIWGAGFFYDHQKLNFDIPVYAVRGELTRSQIGKDVPVGDPALLLPLFYSPSIEKKHKIGVIPHWSNMAKAIDKSTEYIIDPMQSVKDFVDDILSCEIVYSESLHGLIISDAYKVPNKWVKIGGDVGGDFKYLDYYSTVEYTEGETMVHKYKYDLETLLKSCPFYNG